MRVLVADDEAPAREELVYLLGRIEGVHVVDQASSATEVLRCLRDREYDVVFLDIRMPGLTGLEAAAVVNHFPAHPPIVFVTAYHEHALAAFDVAATDYVLKPVSELRLRRALQRVQARRASGANPRSHARRIPVRAEGGTLLLRIEAIRFAYARGHAVLVRTFDAEYRAMATLSDLGGRLEKYGFLRTHRAYLVNPDHVLEIHPFFAGAYLLRMDDKGRSEVPVSRGYARVVRSAFSI
jgi:DNA-binding LytR/AlgR family response regulator